ncbi:MAG TPA: ABC transporter ATP-binding protein [Gemmataceae bacterium]|nr:ABC transporter ATP-binding protein [Gemmataceae bacterium]
MKNFLRTIRFAWKYRGRLFVSVICALLAAAFWGLNFTAIYPVLKILGSEKNLQQWVDEEIQRTKREIEPLRNQVNDLTKAQEKLEAAPTGRERNRDLRNVASDLSKVEGKLQPLQSELNRYLIVQKYIDGWLPESRFDTLAWVVAFVVMAVAFKGLFEFWQETLVGSVVNLALFDMRNKFFRNAIHLDVINFTAEGTHELMARFTNDMELLGGGLKTLFGKVVAEPLRALACVAVACWISWQLTLMFLIVVPIALFILIKTGRTIKRASRRLLERMSSIYKILQESFRGIRLIKSFTREAFERHRFAVATKDYYKKAMWVVKLDAAAGPIIELLGVVTIALALLAGAWLVLGKQTRLFGLRMTEQPLEAESLLQLYCLLAAIADPVRKLSSVYTKIQSGAAASDRIFFFMDRQPKVRPNSDGHLLPRHSQDIEFRDVCFSYDPGHSILTSVHLHVNHGETIAIVGKNGCGKTTLLGMLPRFYDPDHGSIFIDGIDIRLANLRSLRRQVGVVTQDTLLFDDTIHSNIAYGKRHATREEVETAARLAHAHEFITSLPMGYETRVGEAGAKLSGGQKQRLALARVMLLNPSILILDEFTSQTDAESEALIHTAMRDFRQSRTTFVITHRLQTLEIADRIVVVDNGRIVSVGTHHELLKACLPYQRLHEAHSQRLVA